jgi:hypothetical protein
MGENSAQKCSESNVCFQLVRDNLASTERFEPISFADSEYLPTLSGEDRPLDRTHIYFNYQTRSGHSFMLQEASFSRVEQKQTSRLGKLASQAESEALPANFHVAAILVEHAIICAKNKPL